MSMALAGGLVVIDPSSEPVPDGVVLIEDGRIAYSGPRENAQLGGVTVLDCSDCTVTAGFWNSHVHFFTKPWAHAAGMPREQLQTQLDETFTRYGFTTVFDLGSPWENTRAIRDRIASGEVSGPRILSTGEALLPVNAMPPRDVLEQYGFLWFPAPEIANAEQAARAASQLLAAGVDGIKIFPSSPRSGKMPGEAIAAAANASHAAEKPVFAHCDTVEDIHAAVTNGVNVVAHTTPQSPRWDADLIALMKERNVALTPTLALWKSRNTHDAAIEQLRTWLAAGGTVLFGTDLGAVGADPSEEYDLMRAAGMSSMQLLDALTRKPARHFAPAMMLGTLEAGAIADVVVYSGEPSNVRFVLRGGVLAKM